VDWKWFEEKPVISNQYSVFSSERNCVRSTSRSDPAGLRHSRAPGKSGRCPQQDFFVLLVFLLLASIRLTFGQANVVVDFEKAEITGRWVESYEEKGVVFTPAHAPTRSKAKAKVMFFPHIPSGRKGILSAMADDPIPVRAKFPTNALSVTISFWASTGCPARLEAFDADGKSVDKAALDAAPSRKAPGDPIPTFELTVKGTNIAYIEFSGPRVGEYLAADEVRFVPATGAPK
jgi:hypothetical protein